MISDIIFKSITVRCKIVPYCSLRRLGCQECWYQNLDISFASTRMYQNLPEFTRLFQNVPECNRMYQNVPECQYQNLDIQFAGHENLPTAHEAVSDNAGITNFSKSNFVFQQNPISYFIKIHLDSMFF